MELAGLDKFKKRVLKEGFGDEEDKELLHDSEPLPEEPTGELPGDLPVETPGKTVPGDEIDARALIQAITDRIGDVLNTHLGAGTVDIDVEGEPDLDPDSNMESEPVEPGPVESTYEQKIAKRFAKKILEQMKKDKSFEKITKKSPKGKNNVKK